MLRRNWIFRDRSHPFDTDIRWWINFKKIQIHTRIFFDPNWIHCMGHCGQQSYWFLKLIPLLHVSLGTRSLPVVVVFKMCMASWSGWVRTALVRDLLYLLPSMGSVSVVLVYLRNENRGEKVKINQTFSAADDRRRAAEKKARPISIEFMRSFAMHCWWNNGFSRPKNKNKRLAF